MNNQSYSTEAKILIREKWAKPLLQFIHNHSNQKLLYLGLPGPEAEDLETWIEFLHTIFAFQCEDERYPNAYQDLYNKLDKWEKQDLISTFSLFEGFMERVIMEGVDNQNNTFNLNQIVTLYNLDFCNQIDFPISGLTNDGDSIIIYKFDAIKRLLEIQKEINSISTKFILFLTIHCSYKDKKIKAYFENKTTLKKYISDTNTRLKGSGHDKNARSLRLYIIENLTQYFVQENFIPEFLPTIYYKGKEDTPLLFFTIIGTKIPDEEKSIAEEINIEELIKQKFISTEHNTFINYTLESLDEIDNFSLEPIPNFQKTPSFKKYWQQ